jgi:hypothetical protein
LETLENVISSNPQLAKAQNNKKILKTTITLVSLRHQKTKKNKENLEKNTIKKNKTTENKNNIFPITK